MKKAFMIKLKPQFQRLLFIRIIKAYRGSIKAGRILKIPASSLRGYKNSYFNSVPEKLLNRLLKINLISQKEIEDNTLSKFLKEDQIKNSLNYGRKIRENNLIVLKDAIPKISEIISKNRINFEKWFKSYFHLLNFGFRKSSFSIEKSIIKIRYNNFTNKGIKRFEVIIPKKFILNNEFIYFFGLWCGDRAGGKRLGICNQNKEIIKFTEHFLAEHHQRVERILYISRLIEEPNIKYDKKFILKTDKKGWVLSTHSGNGILASFFIYLQKNLNEILEIIDNKPFFAGLFDAEGNVSLYNKSFRLACKNKESVEIYKKFLKRMDLYDKYDGCCLITYNINAFMHSIFPYMRHSDKINLANFLFTGKEPLPREYKQIVDFIKDNPEKTAKELSKALNKNKIYSELKLLSDFNFISRVGYPNRYKVSSPLGEKNYNTN
jgi:hypothetical protein